MLCTSRCDVLAMFLIHNLYNVYVVQLVQVVHLVHLVLDVEPSFLSVFLIFPTYLLFQEV